MCAEAMPGRYMPYGCRHYKRKGALIGSCCRKEYPCHKCHNEGETHKFDPKAPCEVLCKFCNYRQPFGTKCRNCFILFGRHDCSICRLFDDEDKEMFHCEHCGICRTGGYDNFFHCPRCDVCYTAFLFEHKCIERASRSDCPMCLEYLHTSREDIIALSCGHLIHFKCWEDVKATRGTKCLTCQTMVFVVPEKGGTISAMAPAAI